MNDKILRNDDLITNPAPRLPVCLLLDTRDSMKGRPIEELNIGIKNLIEYLQKDKITKISVEISIVTFGNNNSVLIDFGNLENLTIEKFEASGNTPIASGIELALSNLDERKTIYQHVGVDYYQPWLILMTDGKSGGEKELEVSIEKIKQKVNEKKLSFYTFGIGDNCDNNTLKKLAFKENRVYLIDDIKNFSEFFNFLSRSIKQSVIISISGNYEEIDFSKCGKIKPWSDPL